MLLVEHHLYSSDHEHIASQDFPDQLSLLDLPSAIIGQIFKTLDRVSSANLRLVCRKIEREWGLMATVAWRVASCNSQFTYPYSHRFPSLKRIVNRGALIEMRDLNSFTLEKIKSSLVALPHFGNLVKFESVHFIQTDDRLMKHLCLCAQLRSLVLSPCSEITETGFNLFFKYNFKLNHLALGLVTISNLILDYRDGLSQLEELHLNSFKFDDEAMERLLNAAPKLQSLSLIDGPMFEGTALAAVSPTLERLYIKKIKGRLNFAHQIKRLIDRSLHLTHLEIESCPSILGNFGNLKNRLTKLKTLSLIHQVISDDALRSLILEKTALENLRLVANHQLSDRAMVDFNGNHLKSLELIDLKISSLGLIKLLRSATDLTILKVIKLPFFDDSALGSISSSELQNLTLSCNSNLTNGGLVRKLRHLDKLTTLDLSDSNLTDIALAALMVSLLSINTIKIANCPKIHGTYWKTIFTWTALETAAGRFPNPLPQIISETTRRHLFMRHLHT